MLYNILLLRTLVLLVFILPISFLSFSQVSNDVAIHKSELVFEEEGETYLSILRADLKENLNLLEHISIDYFEQGRVYAYCNAKTMQMIRESGIDYKIEKSPGNVEFDLNMKTWEDIQKKSLLESWDFYPSYDAYEAMMYQFEIDFPELCQVHNIGTLPSGRSLLFLRLTAPSEEPIAKPRFMYTSTMHGDETTGFVLLLRMLHYLLNNYGQQQDVTHILQKMEIWICPNENPDGTYTDNNNTLQGATRGNAQGVDLNRNYPNPVNYPTFALQFETQAMMSLTDSLAFVMSANLHGGIECVNYPWDSWRSSDTKHADHNWWQWVAHEYADTARFYSPSYYMNPSGTSFVNGVTHGGDWYVIHGSRQDYMNYYTQQRELTLEISNTKILPPADLPAHWDYNYRSLLNYMKQAMYGIRGIVTDYHTEEALFAKIKIKSHDKNNSFVYSNLPLGDYYRPIKSGIYNLEVTAEGYYPQIIENVSVMDYDVVFQDVKLIAENPFAPPSNLEANIEDYFNVSLNWGAPEVITSKKKNSDTIYNYFEPDAYQLFRNDSMIVQTNALSYMDNNLEPGDYEYYVKALYTEPEGISHPSNKESVTITEPVTFIITATANNYGTIHPNGEVHVIKGNSQEFTMVADEGFFLNDLLVDGLPVGLKNTILLQNINSNHSIHATFFENEPHTFTLRFEIKDKQQLVIDDAKISLNAIWQEPGEYDFYNLTANFYEYYVSREFYYPAEGTIEIIDQNIIKEVELISDNTFYTQQNNPVNKISLYPNPASDRVMVESDYIISQIQLVSLSGNTMHREHTNSKNFSIPVYGLPSGIYLVIFYSEEGVETQKLQLIRGTHHSVNKVHSLPQKR